MKRSVPLLLCLLFLLFMIPALSIADEVTQNLESMIIESFDDPSGREWYAQASKFVADGLPVMVYAPAWPEALYGRNSNALDLQVLGVKAAFMRQGYNSIEIVPVTEGDQGELVPDPILLPGRVKQLDLWAWGSNYDYYLEVHLRDYLGRVHVLYLGALRYVGWKNLRVEIPTYIPQAGGYITEGGFTKNMEFLKLVVWTKPNENVAGFNIYFDQIKILTDTFVSRFDGDELAEVDRVQEIWSNAGGN